MEGHEVPKNVTEFEFHLVGDMTIKQFAYLGTGLGSAYLLFVTLSGPFPLIAWPLIVITAVLGIAYAFLPISERPLDLWTANFFRAIFAPTQRKYKSAFLTINTLAFNNRLNLYMAQVSDQPTSSQIVSSKFTTMSQFTQANREQNTNPGARAAAALPNTLTVQVAQPEVKPAISPASPPALPTSSPQPFRSTDGGIPSAEELKKTVELAREAQFLKSKISTTQKILTDIKTKASTPGTNSALYGSQLQNIQQELQSLTKESGEISHDLAILSKTESFLPHNKVLVPTNSKSITLVLTTTPNIINGIVTDSQGNYLDGVIIVTHDKQGLPVRALKSNKLGQFLAATPLPNGTYTVTLEKDKLTFDMLEINLDGGVVSPIMVSAKGGVA